MNVVLIPAYEPEEVLIGITQELKSKGFSVLVVDDGSGEKYSGIFAAVKENATVITLESNCGKGAALKFGMNYIRDNLPDCEHFITCDADGQHKVEDVVRVAERLGKGDNFVLTVRNRRRGIPLRSKIGNDMSRVVYALLANRYLSDNQSGLRGFSREHLDWLIKVEKDNYDYEMNVLYYAAKQGVKITTLPIEAIYIENNASSHFSPVTDTVRIYKGLFTRAFGSIISFVLSEIAVLIISLVLGFEWLFLTVPGVGALNCAVNILLNKYIFFKRTCYYDYWNTLAYTVIYYFVYTFGCLLLMYVIPQISLFAAFNMVFIVCIPLRYFLQKFIYIAGKTRD